MKPNYKESAEKYRKLYLEQQALNLKHRSNVWDLIREKHELTVELEKKKQEVNERKIQYSDALDKIIALQEKIAKMEGDEQ